MTRRTKAAERLARLEATAPPTGGGTRFEISADLSGLSDDELQELCERFLATVELTPKEQAMTADQLDEHCRKLIEEDHRRAGLFD